MKIFALILVLFMSITSVYASGFQWSRLYHNRLNTFVRTTKLPPGQYVIGVYSTGNTITEYTEPEPVTNTVVVTNEVIKEVPVEKIITVEKQLDPRTIIITVDEKEKFRSECYSYRNGWGEECIERFLISKKII